MFDCNVKRRFSTRSFNDKLIKIYILINYCIFDFLVKINKYYVFCSNKKYFTTNNIYVMLRLIILILIIFLWWSNFSDMVGWIEEDYPQCQGEQLLSDDLFEKTVRVLFSYMLTFYIVFQWYIDYYRKL